MKARPYTLKKGKPKTFCCECGEAIWDNVDPKRRVVCGDCVQRRLFYFSKESRALGLSIKKARQQAGFSQRTFALAMGCSKSLVNMVEQGMRQPTPKMREFILQNGLSVNIRKQTTCEEGLK